MSVKVAGKTSSLKEVAGGVQCSGRVLFFFILIVLQILLSVIRKLLLTILTCIPVFLEVLVFQYCRK